MQCVEDVTTHFKTKMDPTENMTIVREIKPGRNKVICHLLISKVKSGRGNKINICDIIWFNCNSPIFFNSEI
jgi:hypothetical protein